jgi:preprotein translocase subunit SecG
MYGFLLAVLVVDGLFLGIVILLQAGKGGGLAAVGGGAAMTEGLMGGRQATTVLTRSTWISGTIFMVLAFVLSIMSSRAHQPQSVIQVNPPTTSAPTPEPILPNAGGTTTPPATGGATGTQSQQGKGASGSSGSTGH